LSILFSLLGAGVITANAASILLIDVDFGTPPHIVGNPPVEGFTGPPVLNTVGEIFSGSPVVVSSLGALTNQPLDISGAQIRFFLTDIPSLGIIGVELPRCSIYTTEADILFDSSGGQLVIFEDAPQIRRITFLADLTITATDNFVTFTESQIGTYNVGQVINVRSEIDMITDEWKIFLDDVLVRTSSFGGSTVLSSHRYSAGTTGMIGVDNISILCNDFQVVAVGGELIPLDTTSLILAGTQMTAAWMIPIIVSAAGIGLLIQTQKTKLKHNSCPSCKLDSDDIFTLGDKTVGNCNNPKCRVCIFYKK